MHQSSSRYKKPSKPPCHLFHTFSSYSKNTIHSSTIKSHPSPITNTTSIMSGTSSVGQASVYEAGDQRNSKDSEVNQKDHYHEGKENSHKSLDSSTSHHSHLLTN